MSYFEDIYKKRINRFGENRGDRLEFARRANFERFLLSSPHYTTFFYNEDTIECVLEPRKLNETKTLMDVLCRATQNFDIGSIVSINNRDYMFYYWDERRDSGYNRYVAVALSHDLVWTSNGKSHNSKAYMHFQEDNMLKNELRSRSRSDTLYLENLKLNFLLMPTTAYLPVGTYLTITTTGIQQHFVVTGFDIVSTPGVMYVSLDPTYEHDLTEPPEPSEDGADEDDFFWLMNSLIKKSDEDSSDDETEETDIGDNESEKNGDNAVGGGEG